MRRVIVALIVALMFGAGTVRAGRTARAILYVPSVNLIAPVTAEIPIVNRDYDMDVVGQGVGHLAGTAWLNDDWARIVLAGHNTGLFGALNAVQVGDVLWLWDAEHIEQYTVVVVSIVPNTDTRWLQPTDAETLTLITCDGDLRRVVHSERSQ